MRKFFAFLILSSLCQAQQWSMGYYLPFAFWGNPAIPVSDIQWNGLTHVMHTAAMVNADGTLDLTNYDISTSAAELVAAAHSHSVKVLIDLQCPGTCGDAMANHLSAFVTNLMTVVNTYGYDGVSIDWEGETFVVGSGDGALLMSWAAAMRTALGSKLLFAAAITTNSTYWGTAHTSFDRVNVMTYDNILIPWGPYAGFNCPLYFPTAYGSEDEWKNDYILAGVPAGKIGLGVPFYGVQFTGGVLNSDHAQGISGPYQAWQSGQAPIPSVSAAGPSGRMPYNAIAPLVTSGNYNWDAPAAVPYLSHIGATTPDYWYLSYDNPQSVAAKVQYVIANKLGGWSDYYIGADYSAVAPHQPLLDAVALSLASGAGAGAHSAGMAMSAGGLH